MKKSLNILNLNLKIYLTIKYHEQHICNSISKSKDQYTLKNPILRKNCIIVSLKNLIYSYQQKTMNI